MNIFPLPLLNSLPIRRPIITYSNIEGGWEGEGNMDLNPLFTDPDNSDYTLQEDSSCIDAGTIIEDMEYCGEAPDMGAYEYITEGCFCSDIEGDTNFDGLANILDIITLVNCILDNNCDECSDTNGDYNYNILDIITVVNIVLEN